jgi:very-short-patch-repair endonuclease
MWMKFLSMRSANVGKTSMSRRLRRNATIAEQRLWYRVRSRSLCGMKFVRQEPIGPYIAIRDQWLRDHGYRVLRFWNNDVIQDIDGVLETIAGALGVEGPSASRRLRGEGRGEGAFPQTQTRGEAPSPILSPQAGRGEGRGES